MRTVGRLALALGLCLGSSLGSRLHGQGSWRVGGDVGVILMGVKGPRDVADASRALAALGAPLIPDLYGFLEAGQVSGPGTGRLVLDPLQRVALECALAQLPRSEVTGFLTRLARQDSTESQRIAALALLGRMAEKSELVLCLELGAAAQERLPGLELQAALRSTLSAVAEREDGVARALCGLFARTASSTRPAILEILLTRAGAEAAPLLAGLLGTAGDEADGLVLATLGGLEPAGAALSGSMDSARVQRYLRHPDRTLASLACGAVERLRDHGAVPELIWLLDHSDRNVRQRAHHALLVLTGMAMETDLPFWLEWLDQSMTWWEERADDCRAAIHGSDPASAARALQECASQRLYLDRVVELLLGGLQRPEPDLVRLTCRALRSIPTPAVRAALEPLVHHSDPAIAEEARVSLMRIDTGPSTPSRRLALTLRR